MPTLFFSYSHRDQEFRDQLEVHLAMLKRQGVIETWHDRRIPAGDEFDAAIDENLERASIVLLLVSPDFLASRYCYEVEVTRAMERHQQRLARVIPIILRPCDWREAPFGRLLATPTDGKPVTRWTDRDEAYLDVVQHIKNALGQIGSPREATRAMPLQPTAQSVVSAQPPRSSNLRLKKEFTDADKDRFLDDAFEFMARFFENSLAELQQRNPGIETRFRRLDAEAFSATIYKSGNVAGQCGIRKGNRRGFGDGITFSHDASAPRNQFNESLGVAAGDQSLAFRSLGMLSGVGAQNLTPEGAAELFWAKLVERLQ